MTKKHFINALFRNGKFMSINQLSKNSVWILLSMICSSPLFSGLAWARTKIIQAESETNRLALQFEQGHSEVFSCRYPIDIEYSLSGSDLVSVEKGKTTAILSCPDVDSWELIFRTLKKVITLKLGVNRESQGTFGIVANYRIIQVKWEDYLQPPSIRVNVK